MPFWSRFTRSGRIVAAQVNASRTASVQPLTDEAHRLLRSRSVAQAWQEKARHYGRTLGVVRFSFGLLADTGSRCPTLPEFLVDPSRDRWEPEDDPVVSAVIQSYRNSRDDGPELIRRHLWLYGINGECYQSVEEGPDGPEWHIWSPPAVEIRSPGVPVLVKEIPGGTPTGGGARAVPADQVRRLWQPDEDWPLLATSPMVGILEDCDRYVILGRRTKREAQSALGLNGILFTPSTAHTYPTDANGDVQSLSRLDADLMAIAEKAWTDDDSLAAVAPFSVNYGSEQAAPPKWVEVGRGLNEAVFTARQEALECIARGSPLPQRLVTDATSNHWSEWLVDERFFRSTLAPMMDRTHHGDLTDSMLRPTLRALAAQGRWAGDPERWRVGYDPTPVIVHPDKANRAVELYGMGALSLIALLTETGFGSEDAPSPEELRQFIEVQQALHARPLEKVSTDVGPATTLQGPPTQTTPALAAALAPYASEVGSWLDG